MPFMPVRQGNQDLAPRLREILSHHRGKDNAITSRQLSKLLQLSTREVRALIADLVHAGELVGASVDGLDGGYYIIQTEAELEQTRAILRSRAAKIFDRDRELCKAWARRNGNGRPLQPLLPGIAQQEAHP